MVQWSLAGLFLALAGLTLGGIVLRLVTGPIEGTPANVESMTLFWSLYNVVMLAVAALMCVEAPRFRKDERFVTDEPAIATVGGREIAAHLENLSLTGCRLSSDDLPILRPGDTVTVRIADVGAVEADVRLTDEATCQLAFRPDAAQRAALVRKLFSGSYRHSVSALKPSQFFGILWGRAFG